MVDLGRSNSCRFPVGALGTSHPHFQGAISGRSREMLWRRRSPRLLSDTECAQSVWSDNTPSCARNCARSVFGQGRHKLGAPLPTRPAIFGEENFEDSFGVRLNSSHRVSGNPPGGPGGLEIETAGDAVDVEELARKIKIRCDPALHGFEIDLAQSHAAASNKFILVQRFPINFELARAQF